MQTTTTKNNNNINKLKQQKDKDKEKGKLNKLSTKNAYNEYSEYLFSNSTSCETEPKSELNMKTTIMDFSLLYKIINYEFKNENYVKEAFTRQSAIGERNPNASDKNYQRFEFFGDSILNLVMTELVFEVFADRTEEYLTPLRSDIVKNETLAGLAKELNLGQFLILGKGEEKQNSRKNKHILADIVEALIAAVYFDTQKDYVKTKTITLNFFKDVILDLFQGQQENVFNRVKLFMKQNNVSLDNIRKKGASASNSGKSGVSNKKDEEEDLMFFPKAFKVESKNKNINFQSFGENNGISNRSQNKNFDINNLENKNRQTLTGGSQIRASCNDNSVEDNLTANQSCESSLTDNSTLHTLGNNSCLAKKNYDNNNENKIINNYNSSLNNNDSLTSKSNSSKNRKKINTEKSFSNSSKNKQQAYYTLEMLLNSLQNNLIQENNILDLEPFIPELRENSAFPFYLEYAVRIIHENELDAETASNYNAIVQNANFASKLKNMEIKALFASTKYLLSVSFLQNLQESLSDFATGKFFYFKCQGLYLLGYNEDVLDEIDYCLNSLDKVKNEPQAIEAETRFLHLNALMLKLNAKLKIAEERVKLQNFCEEFDQENSPCTNKYCVHCVKKKFGLNKNKSENLGTQKNIIFKCDLEEIFEFYAKNYDLFEADLELKYYLSALKIKFYFYEFENSESLLRQGDKIEEEIRELEAILTKIHLESQRVNVLDECEGAALLNNRMLVEYANIKIIELKIKYRNNFDQNLVKELKESLRSFIIPEGNIDKGGKIDLIFFPVMIFEFENFIANWSNENFEQIKLFSHLLELIFRTIIKHFGIFSRQFEIVFYKANKIRENLLVIEEEVEDEEDQGVHSNSDE